MSLNSVIKNPYLKSNANGKLAYLKFGSKAAQTNMRLVTHSGKILELKRPPSHEQITIEKVKQCILKNMSNPEYKIPDLAKDLTYSQRQLTRIIKKMTGLSPVHFVLEMRLEQAYFYLRNRIFPTIAQVREEVGILHPSYFNRKFIEKFGIRPKALMQH